MKRFFDWASICFNMHLIPSLGFISSASQNDIDVHDNDDADDDGRDVRQ